ncbi:Stage III sporulation protein AD [Lachnospiraceae bacterium TWA4]|nr:Stage III sporulation protein AD [Lachnospiraceae bacterium TWA4]
MVKVALVGVITALFTLWFKGQRPEYGVYLGLGASILLLLSILGQMSQILEFIKQLQDDIGIQTYYIKLLVKMIGITYLAEFASDVCKDCGCQTLSGQITIYGKFILLGLSLPVVQTLLSTIWKFLPEG